MTDIDVPAADETHRVTVEGGEVVAHVYGDGDEVLLLLQGGPGSSCLHLRTTHGRRYAEQGYKVVCFDQLGTGASDRPDDPSLWTITRYAREVEAVRAALGLGPVHLWGHSWGAMLAIEYACTFPAGFKSLVIAHGIANAPYHQQEVNRLIAAFGPEFVRMRRSYELRGDFTAPEYQAAEMVLLYRHGLRMRDWPKELVADLSDINHQIRDTLIGQEYYFYGNLRNWNRIPDMHRIAQPTLVMTGEHDALTPNEAEEMVAVLPNARLHMFEGIAHVPFFECPDEYHAVLGAFLKGCGN